MNGAETEIQSLVELVAFALIAERRAHERYAADARAMEDIGDLALAGVFRRLAEEERTHIEQLEDLAERSGFVLDLDTAAQRFAAIGAEGGGQDERIPDRATPYGALARAVANEERAFDFYCRLAAAATDPQMRDYAKAFAEEELGHAALLRAQRRQAYRAERARPVHELPDPQQITSREDLLRAALTLEDRLAARVGHGPLASACRTLVASLAAEIEPQRSRPDGGPPSRSTSPAPDAPLAIRDELDRLFSFYDRVAHTARDESVARTAQSLMAATLDRIRVTASIGQSQSD